MGNNMDKKTSVIIGEPNEEYRRMLIASIEGAGDFQIIGSSGDGPAVLEMLTRLEAELLIIDPVLPGMDGLTVLSRLEESRRPKTIILSSFYSKIGRAHV